MKKGTKKWLMLAAVVATVVAPIVLPAQLAAALAAAIGVLVEPQAAAQLLDLPREGRRSCYELKGWAPPASPVLQSIQSPVSP